MGKHDHIPGVKTSAESNGKPKSRKPGIFNEQGIEEAVDDPYRLARLYLSEYSSTIRWREDFYTWTDPAYRRQSDDDVKSELVGVIKEEFDRLGESKSIKITRTLIGNILECLKAICHQQSNREEPFWLSSRQDTSGLIVCSNGILQLSDDGEIKTRPPTPGFFTTNALDYLYDPEADCPLWMDFVDQVWGATSDVTLTVQEMFGYALTDDTSQQKMFLALGPKRSGKGTMSRVLGGLVGEHNVCNPTLGSLQGQFGLEPLYGKRLAIVGDARLSGRTDAAVIVERLLSISGEDSQTIDRKYRFPVTCQLKTRFILISNELPKLNDASATLPSRIVLIPFTKSFYGSEDPKLTEKLLAERPGILNWALCGLRRLKERGRFVQPESSREIIGEMEELSSPVLAFTNECLEIGPGYQSPVVEVFQEWKDWCELKGRKPGNQQTFGRDLRAAVPTLRITRPRIEGRQVRAYETVRLLTK